jgi:tRNA G18 (ribose-2'-O)-methylase SpoU
MKTSTKVQCPSERCGLVFEPPARWLGRNMYCPACGVRMTARPIAVEDELRRRPDRAHGDSGAAVRRLPFVVIVDNVRSLWNIGSIFRTADACGVERLILTGISGCPPRAEITKTALGAEEAVAWDYRGDAARALREVVQDGYVAVALESGPGSRPVDDVEWPRQVCLVVGNEVAGIAPEILDACELRVRIPMLGVKESLNVAVAFGIAGQRISSALVDHERTCHSDADDG